MTDEVPYISASQMKSFARCPKEYSFKYQSDLRGTKMGEGYAALGRAVHVSIEEVLSEYPQLRDETQLEYKFKKVLDGNDWDYPSRMNDAAETCLENAAKYLSNHGNTEIRDVEVDHRFNVSRPDINQNFRAILDVTTDTAIWDWKSGKNVRVEDEKIQGSVYMAAYTQLYGHPPDEIRFVYLRKGEVNSHSSNLNEDDNEMWENMIRLAKKVKRAWKLNDFPAKPDPSKCFWCAFEGYCEFSAIGTGDWGLQEWEAYP